MSSAWAILVLAGMLEICWAIGLKYAAGFTRPVPSVLTLVALTASMYLLARAAQSIPIGTAYAVWVGIGAAGASILGIVLFKEPVTLPRIGFVILLIVAIMGLKMTAQSSAPTP